MRTNELLTEAEKWIRNGDIQEAIQVLNQLLIIKPDDKELKELLVDLYTKNGKTEDTLSIVDDLLKTDPENLEYLIVKANCLNDLNELEESLELYNKIITTNPQFYEAYGGRGILYHKTSQLEKSLADLNKAIDNTKRNAIFYGSRALLFLEKEDFKLALKDLNKTLSIDKNLNFIKLSRAFTLNMLGKHEKALREIEKIEHIEVDSESHHQKGIIYQKNNRFEDALANFDKAIELDDNNVRALYSRAMFYAQLNNYENAFQDLDLAMQRENPDFKDFLLNGYADVYRKMKDYDKAIQFAREALDYNSAFFSAYITLAEIYGELGDNDNFYKNLRIGLEAGFDLEDIDERIKKKYFKDKEFKKFLKNIKKGKFSEIKKS
ncbi:MAG: tetratricopeptide repeat protein [Mangrovibacterium sp.]